MPINTTELNDQEFLTYCQHLSKSPAPTMSGSDLIRLYDLSNVKRKTDDPANTQNTVEIKASGAYALYSPGKLALLVKAARKNLYIKQFTVTEPKKEVKTMSLIPQEESTKFAPDAIPVTTYRDKHRLSNEEMGEMCGYSSSHLCSVMLGKSPCNKILYNFFSVKLEFEALAESNKSSNKSELITCLVPQESKIAVESFFRALKIEFKAWM